MTNRRHRNVGDQKRTTRHAALPSQDHNGGWRIRWIDSRGKRRSRNFPPNGYKEAVAELERLKGETRAVKDGRAPAPKTVPTLADFVERYWKPNRTLPKRSPKDDLSILNRHLLPAFGQLRLNSITTERIESFKAELQRTNLAPTTKRDEKADSPLESRKGQTHTLSPKTVHNILTLLVSILRYAQELDFLFLLPKVRKPKIYQQETNYLQTEGQIKALLSEAKKEGPGFHALVATALFTGLRAGELFGLRWTDVNLNTRLITVARSFDKPTKTGTVRHVPILDVLLPTLRTWRKANNNDDIVFPNEAGNLHTPSPRILKETFPAVLRRAELQPLRFHDLRHSFASRWVLEGGDLYKLQRILGHSSFQMVQRYAHLAPAAFVKDRGIFGKPEPTKAKTDDHTEARERRAKRARASR